MTLNPKTLDRFVGHQVDISLGATEDLVGVWVVAVDGTDVLLGDAQSPTRVKIRWIESIKLHGVTNQMTLAARTKAASITRSLRKAINLAPSLKDYVNSKVKKLDAESIEIHVQYARVAAHEAGAILRELKNMADKDPQFTLYRYSSFEATVRISTVPQDKALAELDALLDGAEKAIEAVEERTGGKAECPHVWVTALDGEDRPARDDAGRTWQHCGLCGLPKSKTAALETAEKKLADARPSLPESQDAGDVEILLTPDELVRIWSGSRLGVMTVGGQLAYARLTTPDEYRAWLDVEKAKVEAQGQEFPQWTEEQLRDLDRKLRRMPDQVAAQLLGVPHFGEDH